MRERDRERLTDGFGEVSQFRKRSLKVMRRSGDGAAADEGRKREKQSRTEQSWAMNELCKTNTTIATQLKNISTKHGIAQSYKSTRSQLNAYKRGKGKRGEGRGKRATPQSSKDKDKHSGTLTSWHELVTEYTTKHYPTSAEYSVLKLHV